MVIALQKVVEKLVDADSHGDCCLYWVCMHKAAVIVDLYPKTARMQMVADSHQH